MVYVNKRIDTQYNIEVIPKYSKKFIDYIKEIFSSVNKLFCDKEDDDSNINVDTDLTKENVPLNAVSVDVTDNIPHNININPHFKELVQKIKTSFNEISKILNDLMPEYEEEYYIYDSIMDMDLYILDNLELLKDNYSFITNTLNYFYELLTFKKDLTPEDYTVKLGEFKFKLMDFEQEFYTKMYTPSENYDEELLAEITNSLLDL